MSGKLTCTQHVSGNFICNWKLENFGQLSSYMPDYRESPPIHDSRSGYDKWYLKIFPTGDNGENKEFVSLYLCNRGNRSQKMKVSMTFELRDIEEKVLMNIGGNKFDDFCVGTSLGYRKLIKRSVLIPALINDVLVIHANIRYTLSLHTGTDRNTEVDLDMYSEIMRNDMRRLLIENKGTDVVISVGEEKIPAHCTVLAARSKVFAAMFEHDTKEKGFRRVFITDFDADSVKALLQFMYTGSLDSLTIDRARNILRAADKYDVADLKSYCGNYLISQLDIGNVGDFVVDADLYNATNLRENAIRFICDKKDEFDFEKHESAFASRGKLMLDITKSMAKKKKFC